MSEERFDVEDSGGSVDDIELAASGLAGVAGPLSDDGLLGPPGLDGPGAEDQPGLVPGLDVPMAGPDLLDPFLPGPTPPAGAMDGEPTSGLGPSFPAPGEFPAADPAAAEAATMTAPRPASMRGATASGVLPEMMREPTVGMQRAAKPGASRPRPRTETIVRDELLRGSSFQRPVRASAIILPALIASGGLAGGGYLWMIVGSWPIAALAGLLGVVASLFSWVMLRD